jgi:hypothetical protein
VATSTTHGTECYRSTIDNERHKGAVFLGVTNLVQSPEGIIPSFVWFEPSKQRCDFRWQICANLPFAINISIECGKTIRERKIGFSGIDFAAGDCGGVTRLIENGPEVVCGIEKDAGPVFGEPRTKSDFMDVLNGIGVFLNHMGPLVTVLESVDLRFKVTDVMMCAPER